MNQKIHKMQRFVWSATLILGAMAVGSNANALEWSLTAYGGFATTISTFGTDETIDRETGASVDVEDFLGGSGPTAGFGVGFHDVLPWDDFTIGAQYIYTGTESRSKASIDVPNSPIGPVGAFSVLEVDIDIHTVFANIAYAPTKGKWQPYLGVGLGGGIVDLQINDTTEIGAAGGTIGGDSQTTLDSPHVGVQAFFGFDYNVWKNLNLGLSTNWYYINANIIDEDIQVSQLMVLGSVGWVFK
jgi:opacity protein-like surface antigen